MRSGGSVKCFQGPIMGFWGPIWAFGSFFELSEASELLAMNPISCLGAKFFGICCGTPNEVKSSSSHHLVSVSGLGLAETRGSPGAL